MLSLSSLLTDPNEKDPLEPNVATMFKTNRKEHDRQAREWTMRCVVGGAVIWTKKTADEYGIETDTRWIQKDEQNARQRTDWPTASLRRPRRQLPLRRRHHSQLAVSSHRLDPCPV
jgi:hypothetical protein